VRRTPLSAISTNPAPAQIASVVHCVPVDASEFFSTVLRICASICAGSPVPSPCSSAGVI